MKPRDRVARTRQGRYPVPGTPLPTSRTRATHKGYLPPAEADCQGMLARSQAAIVGNKVTTYFRRTTVCATKFDKLTKAPVRPRLLGLFPSLWMSQVSVRLPVPLG